MERFSSRVEIVILVDIDIDQLAKIFDVLGTPQDPTLTALCSSRVLKYLRSWPIKQKANFSLVFPKADQAGLDLLNALLTFDPASRITADQSLAHPYLTAYHIPDDEPAHPKKFDFGFEAANTIEEIKVLIAKEVNAFKNKSKTPEIEVVTSPRRS